MTAELPTQYEPSGLEKDIYKRWLEGRGGVGAVVGATVLASAFDWYGLYTPVLCAAHLFVTVPARRGAALGLLGATLGVFGRWIAWSLSLPGQSVHGIDGAADIRGWGALFLDRAALAEHYPAWLSATSLLMPGWPFLLFITSLNCWPAS